MIAQEPAPAAFVGKPSAAFQRFVENPWVRFAGRRGRRMLVSLWVIVTASFFMIHLIPGDPVRISLGMFAPEELIAARRDALGLNEPLWRQYLTYLQDMFTGDWGRSIATDLEVREIVASRLPASMELGALAFVLIMAVSVPLGVVMAALTRGGRRRKTELAFTSTSIVLDAIPSFVLAVGLVYVFGVTLGWVPVAGRSSPESYILPVLALAGGAIMVFARIVRVEVLAILEADYIRTARAKRLPTWRLYLRHALPNAATTTLTLGGMLLAGLLTGSVLVENVFAWPGLGTTIIKSILSNDYPVVQTIVLVYGVGVLSINLIVDVALAIMDPRSTIREN